MKIAITGAGGFIGRYLLDRLGAVAADNSKEISVIALTRSARRAEAAEAGTAGIEDIAKSGAVNTVTDGSGGNGSAGSDRFGAVTGLRGSFCTWQVTDYSVDSLRTAVRSCDAVVHLAGVKGADGSMQKFSENEFITENILEAMRLESVPHIIFASSRLVYSDPAQIPWQESQPTEPANNYGISKAACEHLCMLYARKYGIRYSIVRIAQVLGIGEGTRNMINVFIDSASSHKQLRVMGKSTARRQYIYTKDLAEIIVRLIYRGDSCENNNVYRNSESLILNAGMPGAYTNLEIAQLMNRVFENPLPIDYDPSFPETITSSQTDVSLLIKKTGFTPRNMEEALIDLRMDLIPR